LIGHFSFFIFEVTLSLALKCAGKAFSPGSILIADFKFEEIEPFILSIAMSGS